MANLTITNLDLGNVILQEVDARDELLTFTGAGTVLEGTILARDSVSEKLIPFVKGGSTNEDGIPKAVISYEVVATGAGDEAIRALVAGKVRKQRLVIFADGDSSNVDDVVIDQLRDFSIIALDVQELNILDNQ